VSSSRSGSPRCGMFSTVITECQSKLVTTTCKPTWRPSSRLQSNIQACTEGQQ